MRKLSIILIWNNRQYVYQNYGKKNSVKPSCNNTRDFNIVGDKNTNSFNHRATFYPTSQESLINRTHMSADTSFKGKNSNVANLTYYDKSTRLGSKNTSWNQNTTADISMDNKPLSQRKSMITEKVSKVFEIKQEDSHNKEIDIVAQFYHHNNKANLSSTQTECAMMRTNNDDQK